VWSSITSQLEGAYRSKKIILLDEIGPLQLQTPKFVSLIDQIVDDPAATMFATVALDNSHFLIKKVKRHYRSTLLELNPNKDSTDISGKIKQELKASLRLVNYIPHVLWEGAKS
jgi:nucleoside-triphosphatase